MDCYRITGEDCCLLRMAVSSVAALQETIDRIVATGRTKTSLVLCTPIHSNPILPPRES